MNAGIAGGTTTTAGSGTDNVTGSGVTKIVGDEVRSAGGKSNSVVSGSVALSSVLSCASTVFLVFRRIDMPLFYNCTFFFTYGFS